ncbi:hypothetical protein ACUHMQ_07665 [Chitinimonas sp. PSY-7]|uniref:hypothetical protein n=1 Tax=Chitinimonas sp. PSY-7 TaxID=3459088 RepID=UPI00404024C1
MFDRLGPFVLADSALKAGRQLLAQLPGLPVIEALKRLHDVLAEGLAGSPDSASARRLIELLSPAALACAEQGLTELAVSEDNPTRRTLTGQGLARLADQLANTAYAEAVREVGAIRHGNGRTADLSALAACYFHWLGHASTARALLDPRVAGQSWEKVCQLYLALVKYTVLPKIPVQADKEPSQPLAYLLLASDAFHLLQAPEDVAAVVSVSRALSSSVWLATDFFRSTPLILTPTAIEAHRRVGWEKTSSKERALCYGLDDCQPVLEGLVPSLEPALYELLKAAWFTRAIRARRPSIVRLGTASLVLDFLRVRSLLGQKQARRPANDPFLHLAELLDADEGGVALRVTPEVAAQATGGMMAIEFSNHGWWLARVTRSQADGMGDVLLAGKWLGRKAEPVRVDVAGQTYQALYLPSASDNRYKAALLFDSPLPSGTRTLLVDLGQGEQTVKLTSAERLGKQLLRYRISIRK